MGLILAVAGICAAAASWQIQRFSDRLGYRRVLIIATALAGMFYTPAFFAHSLWQLVLVRAAMAGSVWARRCPLQRYRGLDHAGEPPRLGL